MRENGTSPLDAFEGKVAAEHAFTRVPVASPSVSVEQMRGSLSERTYDSLTHVAILEGTKLVGVLAIEVLFAAPGEVSVGRLMDPILPLSPRTPTKRSSLSGQSNMGRVPSRW